MTDTIFTDRTVHAVTPSPAAPAPRPRPPEPVSTT